MSKRTDFGIINFWWCDDHGAILTAFALQKFVEQAGYTSELLKCWKKSDYRERTGGISQLFEDQNLISSKKEYSTYADMFDKDNNERLNKSYVGFITGSDQVFRPEYVPDSWYLSFVNGRGKIAVAASFGTDTFNCNDEERMSRIKKSIREFDFISIREDEGIKLCESVFGVNSMYLLDPVFLIDKNEYDKIIATSKLKKMGKYIFCYIRDLNDDIKIMISKIEQRTGYDVIWCNSEILVEDFLFYISNCEFVITDSYHGMCFAIIYNKTFRCIRNIDRGKSRFDTIQSRLGISEESYIDNTDYMMNAANIELMDYTEINEKLKALANKGKKWLKSALDETYMKYK